MPFRFAKIGAVFLIFGATLLAYLPALHGGFLWDDHAHVTTPDLQSFEGLRRIWFEVGATQQYYPLLHSAFWVEHRLWGDAVTGYHLVNILLHATAACLTMAVMRRLALPGAMLAGLIFAMHPVAVESVAWISEQKNTLSAAFYLGAMLVYLRFDEGRRPLQYGLALALFGLALLSKTVTATLPAALLVIFWWRRGRLDLKRDVRPLLPWLALGVGAGLFSAWVERTYIGAHGDDYALTLLERGLLAGRVIWFYLGKLGWPADLMFIYPRWNVDASAAWQYGFIIGALLLVVTLGFVARRHRGPLAGFLIFAGTLFPALGFFDVFPFRYSYVADHFQYLASLGIIVPLAAGLTLATRRIPRAGSGLVLAGSGALLAVLGGLTWRQCHMYRDVETLYRETLERNPDCSMAHNNLGDILSKIPGRMPEAIAHFEAAVRTNPRNAEAHNNLGDVISKNPDRLAEAMAEYEIALRIDPNLAQAHNNLGVVLAKIPGRLPEAIVHYETAVRLAPAAAEMHNNLGAALTRIPERSREATAEFETAVRLDPDFAPAHHNLGMALAKIPGRSRDAMAQFEAALRLDPGFVEAYTNLGVILAQDPARVPDAIAAFEAALRLDPKSVQAHNNLGAVLIKIPERTADAIAQFETATRLDPQSADAHNNLANALVNLPGRFSDALREYEVTVRLDPRSAAAHSQFARALVEVPERMAEAIAEFETALKIDPDLFEANYALGVLLSEQPDRRREALRYFEAALRTNPDFAPARQWVERLRAASR